MKTFEELGRTWMVWQVIPDSTRKTTVPSVDADYVGGWLVFQSGEEKRRFAPLPAGWADLTDRELGLLLRHSVSVTNADGVRLPLP
jgi:hypothetical protein